MTAADAAITVHDFYLRADRQVYAAVDDGEANIAYALATQGRYAFVASPVLLDQSRLHGQFNYGPWYFYLAAAVVWVFGFSLTAIRAIHTWVIAGAVAAAFLWFRGRDRLAVPALFALAVLYFFNVVEWPMVRPDSLVSAFAVLLVVSAGLAFRHRRAIWWFTAGLSAACGAFTHLIAASLVISAVALWIVFAYGERRERGMRTVLRSGGALAAGIAIGLAMFYASFGFDLAMQLRFLAGYRNVTATGETFSVALLRHFQKAFGVFPAWMQDTVWLTLIASWVVVLAGPRVRPSSGAAIRALVLPPATVWTLYLLSNGKYTNYHPGYAILHHVMFAWTAAAMLWVVLAAIDERSRAAGRLTHVAAMAALILAMGQQLSARGSEPYAAVRGPEATRFSSYLARVLAPLPPRARAWGTVLFGLEAPERLQLVQQSDAVELISRFPPDERARFAPDYLVLGYPELRDNMLSGLLGKGDSFLQAMNIVLPSARYRLVALTSGWPYGVTHVYARTARATDEQGQLPVVSAYDAELGRWYTRIGAESPAAFHAVTPVRLTIHYTPSPADAQATTTFAADLPPGQYLLRVRVVPGAEGIANRLLAATSAGMLEQEIGELGARGDFTSYLRGDREVFLLADHRGGLLYVSQFDRGAGASLSGITAYPIVGLIADDERPVPPTPMPPFSAWLPEKGVQMTVDGNRVVVDGDDSPYGYQFSSPVVHAASHDRVEIDIPNVIRQGRVCVGVLNGDSSGWLVRAEEWRARLRFDIDQTQGFRVLFANCRDRVPNGRSVFEVSRPTYVRRTISYADDLTAGLNRQQ